MSEEVETGPPAATAAAQPDHVDARAFAEIYAVHAAHVYDYCRALVGSDAIAASATGAALVLAWQLPQAPHLLRAGLFAAARQEALAAAPGGWGWAAAGAADLEAADGALAATMRLLPATERDVLELVYRHEIWPEQLATVLGISARDAYERLAAAEQDFVTVATAQGLALEDIGAAPLATVPRSVWRAAVAELTSPTSAAAGALQPLPAERAHGSLALPRRRLRLTIAAALPVVAAGCWAIVAGAGSAHPVSVHDASQPAAMSSAPRSARSTATPDGAGTARARQSTAPARPGTTPDIPGIALLPSTPAGTVLPVTTTAAAGADQPPETSPSASASASASPSSAAPSPAASPSSAAPSPSASASPTASSAAASPSPSDSPSSASASVPDPTPTS